MDHISESVLKRFSQGQADAFRQIFDSYHGRILAYSYKIAKSSAEAEEITQQVFIRLWEKRHLVDVSRSLDHYLYKITRNCAFNYLKKKAYEAELQQNISEALMSSSQLAEDQVSYNECERLTNELIDTLPEKRQIVFKMHYEEGYSPAEIAHLLGVSVTTVKSQLVKATKTVKEFLLNYHSIVNSLLLFVFCLL